MIIKEFDLEDVFLLSEIIEKMNLNVEIEKYMDSKKIIDFIENNEEKEKQEEQLGKEMFLKMGLDLGVKFVKRMHKAKKEIKKLISDLTGKPMKEVSKMSLKEIKTFFMELVKTEGFEDFLSQAGE
ncbi:hypothetical protein GOQ27_07070 [Clostridium sp. D2Q-11]|uniref:Uncharacterized protein n=1 Tax=Anaeromonas frigoriresistens TaxID=2683708 RepID=A0A942US93_9FIRM|nr:hypothetical protein [Anaeromonas frigoriresistens]MBS4538218.1 hypothetical protein [Anaeromonas frigoriresistens]